MSRDIIVVGASAGGLEALGNLLRELPGDLHATVFAVIHLRPTGPSLLPQLLGRRAALPVTSPQNGELIQPGRVYVAPPDYHMIVAGNTVQLWRGPKENFHRPSINVLFRSAAAAFGKRVIGVVLSGMLDDGAAGLWWIKQSGGLAVVQQPGTAGFPDMPRAALQYVDADLVLDPSEIGKGLAKLTNSAGRS